MGRQLTGRRIIKTDADYIDESNILKVLDNAYAVHQINREEIKYLYNYYKGRQPILDREKSVRPEINNKVVINRANEIVSFKVGYLMGDPVQYVARGNDISEVLTSDLSVLNTYMFEENKSSKDKELCEWFEICGTSYRMVLPATEDYGDNAPFEIYTLDPRSTFVIYNNGLGNKPIMGVTYVTLEDGTNVYTCYTKDMCYKVDGDVLISAVPHQLGDIPIIEYVANNARLGAFEIVLSLLDAINQTASDRVNGIQSFVEALMVFKNVDVSGSDIQQIKALGAVKIPADGDIKIISEELNQGQTQTLVDDMYQTVLSICAMPNRNGRNGSTSDTGAATTIRDGWQNAEASAKDAELVFTLAEKKFIRLAIRITNELRNMSLSPSDIDIRFTRRNYENIAAKSQVLIAMLNNDKIHPKLAFEHSGMFTDPEIAYAMSVKYAEEKAKADLAELESFRNYEVDKAKEEINDNTETSVDDE